MRKKKTNLGEANTLHSNRTKKKKFPWIRILFALVIVLILCFGIRFLYLKGAVRLSVQAEPVYYTPGKHIGGTAFKNTYYLTTIDGLKSVNASGKDVEHDVNATISPFIRAMSEPVFLKSNKTILAYDISGKTALLFDESGIITPLSFDREIIRARMNKKGQFVIVLNEDGSKAAVKVYDVYGNELYTWYSGTGYVVDAVVHPKNDTMVVLTNDVSGGAVTSKLLFFRLDTEEPVRGQIIGDKMAAAVSYTDSYVLVLCSDGLYVMADSGSLSQVMQLNDKKLKFFDFFSNGELLLCYENLANETYLCEVYDKKGRKQSEFMLDAFVRISDIASDKFLVYKRKEVLSISRSGKLLKTQAVDFEIKNAAYFNNKLAVIGQERMILR